MTKRIVSLMGVAAVATMVILAGCSSGPGAAPADEHAAALVGTWSVALSQMLPSNPADQMSAPIEVTTSIAATIAAGAMANMGTLELEISQTAATMPYGVPISVSGTIEVDAMQMTVSDIMVMPQAVADAMPGIAPLLEVPQTFTYSLSDNGRMLTVKNAHLLPILAGSAELVLTKQPAS